MNEACPRGLTQIPNDTTTPTLTTLDPVASPDVDAYLLQSKLWPAEIAALRPILLRTGLDETIKWAKPCYSHGDHNIVIVQEFKQFLALMFFKGALLDDPAGVLESQGANSNAVRRICFRSVADVKRLRSTITDYIQQAIAVEAEGRKVAPAAEMQLIDEAQTIFKADPKLAAAFAKLTPGRRREYNLHWSSAAKSDTRTARVLKHAPQILAGKGLRDR